MNYMARSGLDTERVNIQMHRSDITTHKGGVPVETKLIFSGTSGSIKDKIEMEVD